jgi:hypothetical protein
MRRQFTVTALLLTTLFAGVRAFSVEDAELPPPPKKSGVRITFLPPPMEGALSLGIYDKRGKLVRVLHREATEKEFTVGLNGLITNWDGKDETGQVASAGSYSARGFSVGAFEVEGVAMHGNDWITDDNSPRFSHVADLRAGPEKIEVVLTSLDGQRHTREIALKPAPAAVQALSIRVKVAAGQVKLTNERGSRDLPLADGEAIDGAAGYGDCVWVLVKTGEASEVREYSKDGEFLRRLGYKPGEPLPKRIAASRTSEEIVLLEENAEMERLRVLVLGASPSEATPPDADPGVIKSEATSVWKVTAEKQIWKSGTFDAINARLVRPGGKPFVPEAKVGVQLLANPLLKDAVSAVDVTLASDTKGSYFQAADGLPLQRVAETENLKWAVMGREGGKAVTIFQSDGAVVEEFKVRKLANMMAFDAGDYDWPPGKEK